MDKSFCGHTTFILTLCSSSSADRFIQSDRPKHKRILSKRFALLLQNGESSYLSIDEGADTCEFTSADAIVDLLSPMSSGAEREEEKRQIEEANQSGILAAAGAMFLAVVMAVTMPSTVDVSSAAGLQ